jgi:hypothetical protein
MTESNFFTVEAAAGSLQRTYSFPAYAPVGTHEFRSIEACSLKQLLRGLFVAVAESNQRRSRDSSPLK